jgi:hypothetical protein
VGLIDPVNPEFRSKARDESAAESGIALPGPSPTKTIGWQG